MRVAVTGALGFLGWHTRCALRYRGIEVEPLGRREWADPVVLGKSLGRADAVLHLAGVNRGDADDIRHANDGLATELCAALDRVGARPSLVYANSIQAAHGNAFGDDKQAAADRLSQWGRRAGAAVADVRLPNLFGEHGRPDYNSVVATFCRDLTQDRQPVVRHDRVLPLLHAQDAADVLFEAVGSSGTVAPAGRPMTVSALADTLSAFRDSYVRGDIPDVLDPLDLALFNTFRSFCFPQKFPIHPPMRADQRGVLFECVRAGGGQAQVFCSTSHPGVTRGQHFHRRKIERFLVLQGTAEISLRRLFDDTVVRFQVSGDRPAVVDMPTLWAHAITNTGSADLMTLFWSNELLDPAHPDTCPEPVERSRVLA